MDNVIAYALSFVTTIGSTAVAIGLFASRLERREHFARRLAALVGVVALAAAALWLLVPAGAPADPSAAFSHLQQLALFSALLALSVVVVTWFFNTSVWSALFCCTAGYALQNLASGLTELVWLLCGMTVAADPSVSGHLVRFGLNLLCIAAVYVPFHLAFGRGISREGIEQIDDVRLLWIMVVVMIGVIGFDLEIKDLTDHGLALGYVVALRCFHGLTCVLTYTLAYELLVSRRLQVEQQAAERVLAERGRQYERSRKNIEAINIKCHDIRHQIRHLADGGAAVDGAALDDIAREVDVYDSTVRTGNEALDTILTEKQLTCGRAGITLSCIADGAALDFMSAADIYSLFGNALDNAIEAVGMLDDPTRRSISLVVRKVAGVVSVHVENPFVGTVELRDGLPVTTKGDTTSHGFGVRSMRRTVERYGGALTTLAEDGRFHVNAIIPMP